ncbi:MAG: GTP pyrophosphokinase [Aggregatilineales bacterium]
MPTIEDAILLATQAHRGQRDRGGAPYIYHPLRLMLAVETEAERFVAILHDVVEDSDLSLEDLRAHGYDEAIVEAVDCLTRREGEPYQAMIERIKNNPLARRVKLADLADNMDLRRQGLVNIADLDRLRHYQQAWAALTREA